MSRDLEAIANAAHAYCTATRFPDRVLAHVLLQELLGVGNPAELAATRQEWERHKRDVDALHARAQRKLDAQGWKPPYGDSVPRAAPVTAAPTAAPAKPRAPQGSLL